MVNRICTSIEQSKRLIELGINANTADMYIGNYVGESGKVDGTNVHYYLKGESFGAPEIIPSWSLNALLELMPIETHLYKMQDEDNYTKHYYKVGSCDGKGWIELNNTLAIDAVYEMVCWLKENNALYE